MLKKTTNILIAENVPSLNKGEMTILEGMLESFKLLGETEVYMFSNVPEIDRPRYEPKIKIVDVRMWPGLLRIKILKPILKIISSIYLILEHLFFLILYKIVGKKATRLMKSQLWKEYLNCDLIVIGHDNTYGILVGITYFYNIYLPFFARILNKPIVFYGGSILREQPPVWFWKLALRFSFKWMNLVTLRERITYMLLRKHQLLNDRISVTGDPAFLLQPAESARISQILKQEEILVGSRPLIGLTITREVACEAFSGMNSISSYNQHILVIADAIDYMANRYSANIIFLPHCIGPGASVDDRIIANAILQKCTKQSFVKIITQEYSASELKGLIGLFNMFIGERIHSTINALSMKVPSIVLVNKNDLRQDIIDMLGQRDAICYTNNLDSKSLIEKIDFIWSQSEAIKAELRSQVTSFKERSINNGRLLQQVLDSNLRR